MSCACFCSMNTPSQEALLGNRHVVEPNPLLLSLPQARAEIRLRVLYFLGKHSQPQEVGLEAAIAVLLYERTEDDNYQPLVYQSWRNPQIHCTTAGPCRCGNRGRAPGTASSCRMPRQVRLVGPTAQMTAGSAKAMAPLAPVLEFEADGSSGDDDSNVAQSSTAGEAAADFRCRACPTAPCSAFNTVFLLLLWPKPTPSGGARVTCRLSSPGQAQSRYWEPHLREPPPCTATSRQVTCKR